MRIATTYAFGASHNASPRSTNAQSQPQHPPPSWGSTSGSQQPTSAQGSPNPASYPSYYAEPPSQPIDRHTASQAYARYYNHEADEDDEGWTAVSERGRTTGTKPVTEQPQPIEVKGYDAGRRIVAHACNEILILSFPTIRSTFS